MPGTSATAASNSSGIVRCASAMRARYASGGSRRDGAGRGAGPGPAGRQPGTGPGPTGPGPVTVVGSHRTGKRLQRLRHVVGRRGRSGRRGTWRAPGCAASRPFSASGRSCSRAPCAGPRGPRPARRRAGAAASRACRSRPPRSGRDSKSALRTSRHVHAELVCERLLELVGRGEACRSSACRAPPAPCRRPRSAHRPAARRSGPRAACGACSNAAVTLSVRSRATWRGRRRTRRAGGPPRSRGSRGRPAPARPRRRRACRRGSWKPGGCPLPRSAGGPPLRFSSVVRLLAAGDGRAVVRLGAEAVAHGGDREGAADDDDRAPSLDCIGRALRASCRSNVRAA